MTPRPACWGLSARKLSMDSGENVISSWSCRADYAGALLFFFENGKAARWT